MKYIIVNADDPYHIYWVSGKKTGISGKNHWNYTTEFERASQFEASEISQVLAEIGDMGVSRNSLSVMFLDHAKKLAADDDKRAIALVEKRLEACESELSRTHMFEGLKAEWWRVKRQLTGLLEELKG